MSDAITHNPNTGEELARYPQMHLVVPQPRVEDMDCSY